MIGGIAQTRINNAILANSKGNFPELKPIKPQRLISETEALILSITLIFLVFLSIIFAIIEFVKAMTGG